MSWRLPSTERFFLMRSLAIYTCEFLISYNKMFRHLKDPHISVNQYFLNVCCVIFTKSCLAKTFLEHSKYKLDCRLLINGVGRVHQCGSTFFIAVALKTWLLTDLGGDGEDSGVIWKVVQILLPTVFMFVNRNYRLDTKAVWRSLFLLSQMYPSSCKTFLF